jgi:hypothetical protein
MSPTWFSILLRETGGNDGPGDARGPVVLPTAGGMPNLQHSEQNREFELHRQIVIGPSLHSFRTSIACLA